MNKSNTSNIETRRPKNIQQLKYQSCHNKTQIKTEIFQTEVKPNLQMYIITEI